MEYNAVVAIDIGNTYSGYAFSLLSEYERNPLNISTENWTSNFHNLSHKTLTDVLFNKNREPHSFGYEAEHKYSELVKEGKQEEWYFFNKFQKKLFHKGEPLTNRMSIKSVDGKEMVAQDVFSAVIKFLKCRLLKYLNERKIPLRENEIKWVLTMPPTGDLYTKQFIREATEKADIAGKHLCIVSEPDSAFHYCRYIYNERGMSERELLGFAELLKGGKCLILDCGEDTVDITVHEVLPNRKLKLLQIATGRAWGEAQVNETFKQLIIKIFGAPIFTKFTRLYEFEHMRFWEEFEAKKRSTPYGNKVTIDIPVRLMEMFEDDTGEDVNETIKNTNYSGKITLVGPKFRFQAEVFQSLFEESGEQIVNHIKELLRIPEVSEINTFIMIGRFSECPMIQNIVKEAFPDVRVITPRNPGLSTLSGAVLFGWHEIRPLCLNKVQSRNHQVS